MKKLMANETYIKGNWVVDCEGTHNDDNAERINFLIENVLEEIAIHPEYGGWETLYRDPDDGRYWEKVYEQGEMHGGGPPSLRYIGDNEAIVKYKLSK